MSTTANLPSLPPLGFSDNGTVYFGLYADAQDQIDEENEGNNTDYEAESIGTLLPDLQGNSFNAEEPLIAGEDCDISFSLKNSGGETSQSFFVDFYLSDNSTISTSDYILGSFQVLGGMQSGTGPQVNTSFALPVRGHSAYENGDGSYYIGMIVDADSDVQESNEGNNRNIGNGTDRDSVEITETGYADLTASLSVIGSDFNWGDMVGVEVGVDNISNVPTDRSFKVYLVISNDSNIQSSDHKLAEWTVSAGGTPWGMSTTANLPSLPPLGFSDNGTVYFGLYADAQNQIDEENEANNTDYEAENVNKPLPDLTASLSVIGSNFNWGDMVGVEVGVNNISNVPTDRSFKVFLVISNDSNIQSSDHKLAEWTVPAGGTPWGMSTTANLPSLPPLGFSDNGTVYFGLYADAQNQIDEENEANNTDYEAENVNKPLPDLTASLSVIGSNFNWGDMVGVEVGVNNISNVPTDRSFKVFLVISNDSNIQSSDHKLAEWTVPAGGTPWGMSTTVNLPNLPPFGFPDDGTVYFGLYADALNQIDEENESNNSDDENETVLLTPPTVLVIEDMVKEPGGSEQIPFEEFLNTSGQHYAKCTTSQINDGTFDLSEIKCILITSDSAGIINAEYIKQKTLLIYNETNTAPMAIPGYGLSYDTINQDFIIPNEPLAAQQQQILPISVRFDWQSIKDQGLTEFAGLVDPTGAVGANAIAMDVSEGSYGWAAWGVVSTVLQTGAKGVFVLSVPVCLGTGVGCLVTLGSAGVVGLTMLPGTFRDAVEVESWQTSDSDLSYNLNTNVLSAGNGLVNTQCQYSTDNPQGLPYLVSGSPAICNFPAQLDASRGRFSYDSQYLYNAGVLSNPIGGSASFNELVDYKINIIGNPSIELKVLDNHFDYTGPYGSHAIDLGENGISEWDLIWTNWFYPIEPDVMDFTISSENGLMSTFVAVDPVFEPLVPVGSIVDLNVNVGMEVGDSGVLQLIVIGNAGTNETMFEIIDGCQSIIIPFNVSIQHVVPTNEEYQIYVQFRPGATHGPLTTSDISDLINQPNVFHIEWSADDSYDSGLGNDEFATAAEIGEVTNLPLKSYDDDYFKVNLAEGQMLTTYIGEGLTHRLYVPDQSVFVESTGNTSQTAQLVANVSGFHYIEILDGTPDDYHLTTDIEDVTPPEIVGDLISTSHVASECSNEVVISISWDKANDVGGSGLNGYSAIWTQSPVSEPDEDLEYEESVIACDSDILDEGDWWFHIRAVDNAGNWGDTGRIGPFEIDITPPSSSHGLNGDTFTLYADDGDGCGIEGSKYRLNGGTWQSYLSPLELNPGDVVDYYAIDKAGNAEDPMKTFIAEPATIVVDIEPSTVEASWTLRGPKEYTYSGVGNEVVYNLTAGLYTVTFDDIPCWTIPTSQQGTLVFGGHHTFAATFEPVTAPEISHWHSIFSNGEYVIQSEIGDDSIMASDCVDTLLITFDGAIDPVSVGEGSVVVRGIGTGDIAVCDVLPDEVGSSLTIELCNPLPDADWFIVEVADTVADASSCPVAGDRDIEFGVLFGDVNRDRLVDNSDLIAVRIHRGESVAADTVFYDVNCDGVIDNSDLIRVRINRGHELQRD